MPHTSSFWLCIVIILQAALIILTEKALELQTRSTTLSQEHRFPNMSPQWDIGEIGRVISVFDSETIHYQVAAEADKEWEELAPDGGIIHLGLVPNRRPFTVSMFHQLSCLGTIRKRKALRGTHENAPAVELTRHCFNYIRQMILCRCEIALEESFGKPVKVAVDEYVCRDWRVAYRALEENQSATRRKNLSRYAIRRQRWQTD
ncbi:hypothetical protein HGRIS_010638 [Hohenbuehelia grisea]|uniref:Uncharacterized protein n=1 Tax=Hohenbuehelia grisea TaxID=104357 RepID=A0ABR3IXS7_9AGAR